LNLKQEFHQMESKLCILGFEPLTQSPLIEPRAFQWQT
jgi:hypothetical protein